MSDHNDKHDENAPFRESGSGADYNPQGNWGAERRTDGPSGGGVSGQEGAASGAGDGGFGPEGGYGDSSGEGDPAVRAIGEGDPNALARQAQKLGAPKRGGAAGDARSRHEKG